ncbi:hypothetical protein [Psychrobacter sp. I-STPA10]|uniref:hypothetical protein n=1 Tax=Psychrobacter sp. I-STPA10 TaxID=2585769 RepID=UPI001E3302CC|nr:hypothetical protein [Psychrobacter sp. I-STPA10]
MSTPPTTYTNRPKSIRYDKQYNHNHYSSSAFILIMLYMQKDTTQFLFMAFLSKLQHGIWWAWLLLLLLLVWFFLAKDYWQLSVDRLSYYFASIRVKSMPLTDKLPPIIEIQQGEKETQHVRIYQRRNDMFVTDYQTLKFHISSDECQCLPQLIADLQKRVPNLDIKGKFDCTSDITQIKYYEKKLKRAMRINQLLVVLLLLSIFAKQMVHINYQLWGLLAFIFLLLIAETVVKKSDKTSLEQQKNETISLWYSLIPALLFLLATNIVMLINEYQVTQGHLPTTTITATLKSQDISYNYQRWESEQLPSMPKYFTVYGQKLNFALQKEQMYQITIYHGYLGDVIIPDSSLANAKIKQQ